MNLILNWDGGKETRKTVLYSSSDVEDWIVCWQVILETKSRKAKENAMFFRVVPRTNSEVTVQTS